MRRRDFVKGISWSAAAWPLAARSQQDTKLWKIGFLIPGTPQSHGRYVAEFRNGLQKHGYIENQNFVFDIQWAKGQLEQLPVLAHDLVAHRVDVIVTASITASRAALEATHTIPVVQAAGGDPVVAGLAESLAHPNGNLTGFSNESEDLGTKLLELLLTAVPNVARLGVLISPEIVSKKQLNDIQMAAQARSIDLVVIDFGALEGQRNNLGGLIVTSDPAFITNSHRIVGFAAEVRLPAIYPYRVFAEDGGLMSYGVNIGESYRRAATLVDRILKGAHPGDLPIEQPSKFELVINLKAARALGVTVSPTLLVTADEVIE